ncbi:response regulator transcription factor, partial [Collinsella sp. LCP19S3_B9]|uniref:response regulator transcription factor n=1 Tax=Collinsella sp. LCP19S3_B9 TaxID=3438757 RepID=UPI003F8F3A84
MARILIVEDEEKIARFVTLELEHEGYQVEHAADGRTAVDLALEHDYDLILLDVLLPQLNGMEVLRRVRKHKDVPVIMVTARDAVMDKVAGLDAGADDYLTKPFAIEELFARIRVALKRAEAVRAASGRVVATFAFLPGPDECYDVIEDGQWRSDTPYAVLHRV